MDSTNSQRDERIIKERILWDKAAANYDKSSRFEQAYKLSIQKSRKALKNDDNVLEIACGTGIISLGIADKVKSVTGVDISPEMISVAKKKAIKLSIKNANFQTADAYSLPYENNSFDAILLFNALQVVKEPDTVLKEVYRLLKAGGVLITATDCYSESVPFLKKLNVLVPKLMKHLGFISYLNYFSKKDIISLLNQNRFETLEDDSLYDAPVNYYVIAQKK